MELRIEFRKAEKRVVVYFSLEGALFVQVLLCDLEKAIGERSFHFCFIQFFPGGRILFLLVLLCCPFEKAFAPSWRKLEEISIRDYGKKKTTNNCSNL